MSEQSNFHEIVKDFRPIEVLHLMSYINEEKIGLRNKVLALVSYFDLKGFIFLNEEYGNEKIEHIFTHVDVLEYEKRILKEMDKEYRVGIRFINMINYLDLSKTFLETGLLKKNKWYSPLQTTDKFKETIVSLIRLRSFIKRKIENDEVIPSELKPFIYAFPSIVTEDVYTRYADIFYKRYTSWLTRVSLCYGYPYIF